MEHNSWILDYPEYKQFTNGFNKDLGLANMFWIISWKKLTEIIIHRKRLCQSIREDMSPTPLEGYLGLREQFCCKISEF